MVLADLLDHLRRGILRDTSARVAGDSDQLWSDTQLISYIDEAQRRFARRSLCIRDGSSPVTQFELVPYQQDYVLDPSILSVTSIRNMGNGAWVDGFYVTTSGLALLHPDQVDLARTGHAARRTFNDPTGRAFWDTQNQSRLNPGRPLVFETDETMSSSGGSAGVVNVRLYPIPSLAYAGCLMQMRVARLPLKRLSDLRDVPEVPEDYHLDMLDHAAYLALRVVDHEAGDPARAQEFEQAFDRHVEEARVEIERKTFVPAFWGFGGGAFGYTPN